MLTIRDIKMGTRGSLSAGHAIDLDEGVEAVATDSRLVHPGDLFVAIPGERVDGHAFIPQAIQAGARALLLSRLPEEPAPHGVTFILVPDTVAALGSLAAYWRSKMPSKVVGITGSVGKTSTKEVIASVLSQKYCTLKSEKNLNNEIGLPLALMSLRPEVQIAVLEMGGAYAMGEIEYLCSLARPSVGVVTNVGHVHLERMGTIERIAETKSELVRALPPDGLAVLNRDDPLVCQMAEVSPCPVVWYGLDAEADVRADEVVSEGLSGIRFRLSIEGRSYHVKAPVLGRHSVHTILAAVAVAHAEGMDDQEIIAAVRQLPSGLRLLVNPGVNGSMIIDDTYNASPASVLAALTLLDDIGGRKVAVLGDMAELGSYSEEGHVKVGLRAAKVADLLYTVGPLGELTAEAAIRGGMPPDAVQRFSSVEEATPELCNVLRAGDTVLLKGSRAIGLDKLAGELIMRGKAKQ